MPKASLFSLAKVLLSKFLNATKSKRASEDSGLGFRIRDSGFRNSGIQDSSFRGPVMDDIESLWIIKGKPEILH